jgi:hypothetical protein
MVELDIADVQTTGSIPASRSIIEKLVIVALILYFILIAYVAFHIYIYTISPKIFNPYTGRWEIVKLIFEPVRWFSVRGLQLHG